VDTGGELTAHLTTGAVIVYALEWLKSSRWFSWLTAETKTLNRAVSAILAGAAAVGINWTYSQDGTLIITGVTVTAILTGGYEWLKQFAVQQMLFDTVVTKPVMVITTTSTTPLTDGHHTQIVDARTSTRTPRGKNKVKP
jgi:hypothetical protein